VLNSLLSELPVGDTVYCLGRALVLGILVSSEALLTRHRRVGFERHLILFSAFLFLMGAELLGAFAGLDSTNRAFWSQVGIWVWYPVLSAVALFGIAFSFDFVRVKRSLKPGPECRERIRAHSRWFLIVSGTVLAVGALLMGASFPGKAVPTSYDEMGRASFLLHGIQVAAMVTLAWKVRLARGIWLNDLESRVFVIGCVAGALGAIAQIQVGPHEHLTTLAYAAFVAVLLRDNYRRSEVEAMRANEDRTARTLLFHRTTTQFKSVAGLRDLYAVLMDGLRANLDAESGAIYLLDPATRKLQPVLVQGPYPPPTPAPSAEPMIEGNPPEGWPSITPGEGIVGQVVESGVPIYIYDPADARRWYAWLATDVRSTIVLPLRSPEGVYGVVQVVNRRDGLPFSEEQLRFMGLIVEQAGLAIYNARLQEEILQRQRAEEQLKAARQIQMGLVPRRLPSIPGLSLAVNYQPAQEVGGDYYNFYPIDHDHLGIGVFDVSGKGVPGALLAAITGTFMKMAAPRSKSPAWALNEVSLALAPEMQRGMYVTACYAVLRLSTLQLTLVCAGHPDALIVRERDATCERHKPRGAAIGLLPPSRFRTVLEQETLQLEQGDTVIFFTDGVTEALNAQGEHFGIDRLMALCSAHARKGPRDMTAEVLAAIARYVGDTPQYDDMTIIALRVWPEPDTAPPLPGAPG